MHNYNLNNVVGLGEFHTVMYFMGAVGSNMRGSGLEEAFKLLYGKKTVEYVMTGKVVRGHNLISSALKLILMLRQ